MTFCLGGTGNEDLRQLFENFGLKNQHKNDAALALGKKV
jgi:hypothetical protein